MAIVGKLCTEQPTVSPTRALDEFFHQLSEVLRQQASEGVEAIRLVVQRADSAPPSARQGRDPFGETLSEHLSDADPSSVNRHENCIGDAELDHLLQGIGATIDERRSPGHSYAKHDAKTFPTAGSATQPRAAVTVGGMA